MVLSEIKLQAQMVSMDEAAVVNQLKRKITDYDEQRLSAIQEEIGKLRRRVRELAAMTAKLYEDKYNDIVNESSFAMLVQKNEQERLEKVERLEKLLSEVDAVKTKTDAICNWFSMLQKYLNLQELDRTMIDELIDHIEIGERTVVDGQRRQDVRVFYKYIGLMESE